MNDSTQPDIFIFGEVLYDQFPNEQPVLGGAPFNVCWHLKGFGHHPYFISAVGRDDLGDQIVAEMSDWGIRSDGLQTQQDRPTGVVNVSFDNGEPQYHIQEDVAYDHIQLSAEAEKCLSTNPDTLLYHGTLACRQGASLHTLSQIKLHRRCFIDVNLRDPWWRYEHVMEAVTNAYFVKLNLHELNILSNHEGAFPDDDYTWLETAKTFKHDMGISHLLITRGEKGATLLDGLDECVSVAVPESNAPVEDTVGAGDAFSSVILLGLLHDWPWEMTLERAQHFASYIVTQRGATTKNHNIYDGFRSLWHLEELSHV